MNLFKSTILVLTSVAVFGCGKKVDDVGPQFSIKSMEVNPVDNKTGAYVIKRSDENSGPQYKLEASAMTDIVSVDKNLLCGPVNLKARRALRNDSSFLSFKISESEFQGLNKLPLAPSCQLQVTMTNSVGSTVSKNYPTNFQFDSYVDGGIYRWIIGNYPVKSIPKELHLDQVKIDNPLTYPVGYIYRPVRVLVVASVWERGFEFPTEIEKTLSSTRVEFKGVNPEGTDSLGYRFKVQPGKSVLINSYALVPDEVSQQPRGTFRFIHLLIKKSWDSAVPLVQSRGFEPVYDDLENASAPPHGLDTVPK